MRSSSGLILNICHWFIALHSVPSSKTSEHLPRILLMSLSHHTDIQSTEQAARIPSYFSDWESQNKLKFSRHLNLSPYQEIGLKLRKFGTQYSYKINNNTSFIIITEHISPSLSTFIGCKWEKTVKVQTWDFPQIMETWGPAGAGCHAGPSRADRWVMGDCGANLVMIYPLPVSPGQLFIVNSSVWILKSAIYLWCYYRTRYNISTTW